MESEKNKLINQFLFSLNSYFIYISLKVNKFKNNVKEQLFGSKNTPFHIFFALSKRLTNFSRESFAVREAQREEKEKGMLMLYYVDAYAIGNLQM